MKAKDLGNILRYCLGGGGVTSIEYMYRVNCIATSTALSTYTYIHNVQCPTVYTVHAHKQQSIYRHNVIPQMLDTTVYKIMAYYAIDNLCE